MRKRSNASIALLLLLAAGLACSFLRPKPKLTWHLLLEIDAQTAEREQVMNQTIWVLEKRLNAAGVKNWAIKEQGSRSDGRILVSLPKTIDPERLKYLITTGGKLEIFHVVGPPNPAAFQTYNSKEEAYASMNAEGMMTANRTVLPYAERQEFTSEPIPKWVVVEMPAIVTGADLKDASAGKSSFGDNYDIQFTLNKPGARRFGDWTAANIGQYVGIVLDGEVKSVASIHSQITDRGQISGRFTKQAAEDLAVVLRAGALPAPIKIVEERVDK